VYATSGSLGVDKSTDGGQSWIESNFPGFGKAVTAIVIDPNDATIVYAAATGSEWSHPRELV